MAGNTVRLRATLDDQVSGRLDKIRDGFDRLGRNKGAQALLQGVGMGAGIAAWGALSGAVSGAVDVLGQSIQKAIDEQAGLAKLDTALRANIDGWDGNTDAIEGVIAQREKLAFSDDDQRESLSQLVTRTHDVTKAQNLQAQAMDLARLKGIDLASASTIIGKVYSGNVAILQRYGIQVSKGATSTQALAEIQRAAAGQAEAYGESAKGSLEGMQIAVDDLQEDIGTELLPVVKEVATVVRDDLVPALSGTVQTLKDNSEAIGLVGDAAKLLLDPFGLAIDTMEEAAGGTKEVAQALHVTFGRTAEVSAYAAKLQDVTDETDDTATATDDLTAALEGLHGQVSTAQLDQDDLQSEYRESKLSLAENIEKLEKLQSIKHPTRDQRRDIEQTRQAVNDDKRDVISATLKLHDMGKVSFSQLVRRLNAVGVHVNDLNLDARTLLRLLTDIGTSTGGSRGGSKGRTGTIGGQAEGGWSGLNGPELAWRGEKGPEYTITNDEIRRGALGGPSATPDSGLTVRIEGISRAQLMDAIDRELYVRLNRAGS